MSLLRTRHVQCRITASAQENMQKTANERGGVCHCTAHASCRPKASASQGEFEFMFVLIQLSSELVYSIIYFVISFFCLILITGTMQKHTTKLNIISVEEYLACLREYLMAGGFIHTFKITRNSLRPNTVVGYLSSIRKYLEVIANSTRPKKRKASKLYHFILSSTHIW